MCIIETSLLASAHNITNPLNHINRVIVKEYTIIRENIQIINILVIVIGVVYGSCCLLLMIGAHLQKRWLLFPYLIIQILITLLTMILGIILAAFLFQLHHSNDGYFVSLFVLLTLILSLYCWKTVNKASVKLRRKKSKLIAEMELIR